MFDVILDRLSNFNGLFLSNGTVFDEDIYHINLSGCSSTQSP